MKLKLFSSLVLAVSGEATLTAEENLELFDSFQEWSKKHKKTYENPIIRQEKFQTYKKNHAFIETHNNKTPKPTYKMSHNKFSDMTFAEFSEYYHLDQNQFIDYSQSHHREANEKEKSLLRLYQNEGLPEYVDWEEEGAVTRVKDQGNCGSCWAFTAAAVLEGLMYFENSKEITDLSTQHIVDCDERNWGCSGGEKTTFQTIQEWGGLCAWEDYPYKARDGMCKMDRCDIVNGTDIGSIITGFGADDTKANIALSPTWVAVYVNEDFQFYSEGIFTSNTCGFKQWTNHAITAVGYGVDEESGKSYYKVKNSWGDDWGDQGYIYFDQESLMPRGTCAVESEPTTVSMYC